MMKVMLILLYRCGTLLTKTCLLQTQIFSRNPTNKKLFLLQEKKTIQSIAMFAVKDWKITESAWRDHTIWSLKYVYILDTRPYIRIILCSSNITYRKGVLLQSFVFSIQLYQVRVPVCMFLTACPEVNTFIIAGSILVRYRILPPSLTVFSPESYT